MYDLSEIEQLYDYVIENKEQVLLHHKFLSDFDLYKLVEMILKCSPFNLDVFRRILRTVYEDAKNGDFLNEDIDFMRDLKKELKNSISLYKLRAKHLDKILLNQIDYLFKDMTRFIDQIS